MSAADNNYGLTPEEGFVFRAMFGQLDEDKDGFISATELGNLVKLVAPDLKVSKEELDEVVGEKHLLF